MQNRLSASVVALALVSACSSSATEPRPAATGPSFAASPITTTTECVKIPGPQNLQVTTATNPGGNPVPGQSSTELVPNRECKK
jgi:hypothetical protein